MRHVGRESAACFDRGLRGPLGRGEFGRGAPIRSRAQPVPEPSSTPVGRGVELHVAPTNAQAIRHVTRAGVWGGRAMVGRSDGGTEESQSESRDVLPVGGDQRAVQVRLGGTREGQNGGRSDTRVQAYFDASRRTPTHQLTDRRRKRILQSDLRDSVEGTQHSAFFNVWGCESLGGGTI